MEIHSRKTALMISNGLLAGALSVLVCVAQSSPATHAAAGRPSAPSTSQSHAAAGTSSPGKVVLKVGETKITRADVEYIIRTLSPQVQRSLAVRGRKPVGDEYAMMVLLSQKAQSDHLDASPDFRRQVALEKLKLLAQEEYRKMAEGIQVTPDEISAYYNAHLNDFQEAQIREFVVRKKPANAEAGAAGLSPEAARARLASIRKAVEAGTDIKEVAKKFDVPDVIVVSPEPETIHKGQLIPSLDKLAFSLKDNQFSAPVETPRAVVLLQVLGHQKRTVKDASEQIANQLRQEKLKSAMDDMRTKANIWMDPSYFSAPQNSPGTAAMPPHQP